MEKCQEIINNYMKEEDIKMIFDIGSRDCLESVQFSDRYCDAQIFAIECNPSMIPICKNNIKEYPNIKLIDKAINNFDGICKFYPINVDKTITTWEDGNPGASSLFEANGLYDHIEKYVQDEIDVECVRLDTICKELNINKIDVIWMDLQGAELLALESLGEMIDKVGIIYTEISHKPIYDEQCLFEDIDDFLYNNHFERLMRPNYNCFQEDMIYINKKLKK